MSDKLDLYDILSTLLPGTLLLCWVPIWFPAVLSLSSPKYPDAFAVVALTALAIFTGYLIQALASLAEKPLFWSWGGRPSDRIMAGEAPRTLPADTVERITAKLKRVVGDTATSHSLFIYALQRTDGAGIGRATKFSSLYAFHRSLLVFVALLAAVFAASAQWGAAKTWSGAYAWLVVSALGLVDLLLYFRTKQRGFHYAREVLMTMERLLDKERSEKAHSRPLPKRPDRQRGTRHGL